MTNSHNIKTNNNHSQPQRPNMNPNTNVPYSIYRLNKPTRTSTPLFYTNHPTIYKLRHSNPPMSRNRYFRFPPQDKSFPSTFPTSRNPSTTNSYTSNHRNYQPIYSTNSPSRTAYCQYHCWTSLNSPDRRCHTGFTKY